MIATDLKCGRCNGEGEIDIPPPPCTLHAGSLSCPCWTADVEECGACGGSGVTACSDCGDAPAEALADDGFPTCRGCLDEATGTRAAALTKIVAIRRVLGIEEGK